MCVCVCVLLVGDTEGCEEGVNALLVCVCVCVCVSVCVRVGCSWPTL